MRVRIRKRHLRLAGIAVGTLAFLAFCYVLGNRLTPRDGAGRPLILSPSIYAAERYRRAALEWLGTWEEVDRGLTGLLAEGEVTDPAQLYAMSREAERLVQTAMAVAQDAAFTPPPTGLVGLAERLRSAAEAHLAAAQAAARWVGAPEPENRYAALEALRTARALRLALAADPWLRQGVDGGGRPWYYQGAIEYLFCLRRPDFPRLGRLGPGRSGFAVPGLDGVGRGRYLGPGRQDERTGA